METKNERDKMIRGEILFKLEEVKNDPEELKYL